MQYDYLTKITHINTHFVHIFSTLANLSKCLVVQLLAKNVRNVGHLCKHRHANRLRSPLIESCVGNILFDTSNSHFSSLSSLLDKLAGA